MNDYRISFQLSNDTHNFWMYTDRTFVGQATPPELLHLSSGSDEFSLGIFDTNTDLSVHLVGVEIEEIKKSEDDQKRKFVLTFSFDADIIIRVGQISDFLSFTGNLVDNVESVKFNQKERKIIVKTKDDLYQRDVTLNRYGFILNSSSNPKIVRKLIDPDVGFSLFPSVDCTQEEDITNRVYIDVDEKIHLNDSASLIFYNWKKYFSIFDQKELLQLRQSESSFSFNTKEKLNSDSQAESFSLPNNPISEGSILYSKSDGSPI